MPETRPCPVCHGSGCKCCGGQGRIPFPWVYPDDATVQQRWTTEEVEVINGAATASEAYQRYVAVFGYYERTGSSIEGRWRRHCGTANCWTSVELATIDDAPNVNAAYEMYRAEYGTARNPRAVMARWHRLRKTGPTQT